MTTAIRYQQAQDSSRHPEMEAMRLFLLDQIEELLELVKIDQTATPGSVPNLIALQFVRSIEGAINDAVQKGHVPFTILHTIQVNMSILKQHLIDGAIPTQLRRLVTEVGTSIDNIEV